MGLSCLALILNTLTHRWLLPPEITGGKGGKQGLSKRPLTDACAENSAPKASARAGWTEGAHPSTEEVTDGDRLLRESPMPHVHPAKTPTVLLASASQTPHATPSKSRLCSATGELLPGLDLLPAAGSCSCTPALKLKHRG